MLAQVSEKGSVATELEQFEAALLEKFGEFERHTILAGRKPEHDGDQSSGGTCWIYEVFCDRGSEDDIAAVAAMIKEMSGGVEPVIIERIATELLTF